MRVRIAVAIAGLVVAGCGSIQQNVEPAGRLEDKQICVMRDHTAREGFLHAYQKALERKGFTVTVVEEAVVPKSCSLVSHYRARWGLGFASPTLTYVDIQLIKDGVRAGRANYNATSSRSMEKVINADNKINELVDLLFPSR